MNTEVVRLAANSDWLIGAAEDVIQEVLCIWPQPIGASLEQHRNNKILSIQKKKNKLKWE